MSIISKEEIMQELGEVVNHFEEFKRIAADMPWIAVKEAHEDWFQTYPLGITLDCYWFPGGYLQENMKEAYVRAILSSVAHNEEWDKDFFLIRKEKRIELLEGGKSMDTSINFLENAVTYKDLRIRFVSNDFLEKEIRYFADENEIQAELQDKYLKCLEGAIIIELGGCYSGDYSYIVVKDDILLCVNCGIWD